MPELSPPDSGLPDGYLLNEMVVNSKVKFKERLDLSVSIVIRKTTYIQNIQTTLFSNKC
jgi:hypothetical protein